MAGRSRGSAEPTSASRHISQDSDDDDEEDVTNGELWNHRRLQRQVGYLSLEGSFSGGLSPQPSSSAECERRVSPLDPNLSSAARYSPPPPYAAIEGSLDQPDSPMEELTENGALPRYPVGVSSSLPSGTVSLAVSEAHRATPEDHDSSSRTSSLFSSQRILVRSQPRWDPPVVVGTDDDDEDEEEEEDDDDNEEAEEEVSAPLSPIQSVWAKQRKLNAQMAHSTGLKAGPSYSPQPGPSGSQNYAGPSGSQNYAGPSGSQNYAGPSSRPHTGSVPKDSGPLAGPSGISSLAGPSGISSLAGPSGISSLAGPSGISSLAGPSGISSAHHNIPAPVHLGHGGVGTSEESVYGANSRSNGSGGVQCSVDDLAQPGPSRDPHLVPQPSPSILQDVPQPSPSGDGMVSQTNRGRSADSDTDSDSDSQDNLPHFSNSPGPSGIGGHLVRLHDGEAEALVGNVSGCEASSSIRGNMSPLGSPRTPADNCIVSSSTGHIDSIPPTPAEFQGNDVSGPSSPASPNLASVAILDSTVDSTSGRGMMEPPDDSDDDSDDNLGHANQMQLPVISDEAAEISTSEIGLQHSDDSQDVSMLVSPQGMFASGRASANRLIEQLSLSLSHFSSNSLDGSLSGEVSDQRTPQNTPPAHPDPGPYMDDPLAIPGPSRLSLPCPEPPATSQTPTSSSASQGISYSSRTQIRPQMLTHPVEVLDSSLPLLHISAELPVCSTESDNQVQDSVKPEELEPLVNMAPTSASSSLSNDVHAGSSANQELSQLNPSYVLINEDNSLNSDSALSSSSLVVKEEMQGQAVSQADYSHLDSNHHSLVDPSRITSGSLGTSLSLGLASSELNGVIDAAIPGPSRQPSLSQHIIASQSDQVSLLVSGGEDSSDGALLMMLSSNSHHALHDNLVLGKQLQREANDIVSQLPAESEDLQEEGLEEAQGTSDLEDEGTPNIQSTNLVTSAGNPIFIGPGIWCGECEQSYSDECVEHRIQQAISDKPVRTRAWASLPAQHLVIRKIPDTGEFGVFVRKAIHKRTQFGPVEGELREPDDDIKVLSPPRIVFTINQEDRTLHLDTSNEATSNWMRFVRQATTYLEQNCVIIQTNSTLVFLTTTDIAPRSELRVGYSKQYADRRGLTTLQPTQEEIRILEALRKSWPCYECDEAFESSAELQQHLVCHDEEIVEAERKKRKRIKTKRPRANGEVMVGGKRVVKKVKLDGEDGAAQGTSQATEAGRLAESAINAQQQNQCMTCNLVFPIPDLLRVHQLTHEGFHGEDADGEIQMKLEERACPQCFKVFETAEELLSHIGEHGFFLPLQARPFKCDFCYKSFSRRERLEAHMAVHGNETEKPFRCNLCLRRFCSNTALNTHIKFHIEGSKGYDCPICREGFFTVAGLKSHVSTHCVNGEYGCPTCKKVFPTYSKIRRHIRSYHAVMPHTCSICRKEMPSVEKLKIHMLTHSDRRDFLCPDCGKRFKRKDKLREHTKRMHSSERIAKAAKAAPKGPPSKAPKVDPSDYKQFLYKCHTCLLGFKRRGMLVNHLAKRHPNIDLLSVPELNQPILKAKRCYSCQHCDKMYRSSSKRKLHILKNHPGAELPPSSANSENENGDVPAYSKSYPHPCMWCFRQYASRARLLRHQRNHHPEHCHSQQNKEYSSDVPELSVDGKVEASVGLAGELTLASPIVTDAAILRNHRLVSLARASEDGTVEIKEDDLLTQAMGEITPLAGGEQCVRILEGQQVVVETEGQQVVVETTAGGRPLLVNSNEGQQGPTLALVTTLPAGQFISWIPGLSVAAPASTTTSTSRATTNGSGIASISNSSAEDVAGPSGSIQTQSVPGTIRMASTYGPMPGTEAGTVEQVVLAHQPASQSTSVVWPSALTFGNNTS